MISVLKQRVRIEKHILCALNYSVGFSFVMNVWIKSLASSVLPNFCTLYLDLFFRSEYEILFIIYKRYIYIYIYIWKIIPVFYPDSSLFLEALVITMYIPPNGRVNLSKQKLTNEMGLFSNIKSKVVQKHMKTALKSAL